MRRLAILMTCAIVACDDGTAPHIDGLSPDEGGAGTMVAIVGARFCGEAGADEAGACAAAPAGGVSFGLDPQVTANVVAWRDDRITVVVPASVAPGDVTVVVTVDGRTSNGVTFRVR